MVSIPARTNPARRGRSRRARRAQGFLPRRLVRGAETGSTFLVPGRRLRTPALSGIPSGFAPLPSPDPWAIADRPRSRWNTTQKAASGKLRGRGAQSRRAAKAMSANQSGLKRLWSEPRAGRGEIPDRSTDLAREPQRVELTKPCTHAITWGASHDPVAGDGNQRRSPPSQLNEATKQQDNEFQLHVNRNLPARPICRFSLRKSLFFKHQQCGVFCTLDALRAQMVITAHQLRRTNVSQLYA